MTTTQTVGWALVHFLWQGALIALATRAILALLAGRSASARYAVAVAGLAIMPIVVAATMLRTDEAAGWSGGRADGRTIQAADRRTTNAADENAADLGSVSVSARPPLHPSAASPVRDPSAASPVRPSAAVSVRQRIASLLPAIVLVWFVGVIALALRLIGGFVTLRRMVGTGLSPAPRYVTDMVERLSAQLGVRRVVAVFASSIARVPAVVGWLKPVILIPASALSGLAPAQVEMILAHELAHVRRHDYLVNLLQSVIETLLFYHPAVWWVGARVREEREHCCDDIAVRATGNRIVYAEALLSLELARAVPVQAMAATGGSLLSRVERLLLPGARRREVLPRWIAGAAVMLVLALGFGGPRLVSSDEPTVAPEPKHSSQDTSRARPDTVIRFAQGNESLADRIAWGHRDAQRRNARLYWLAWSIDKLPSIDGQFMMGRLDRVGGFRFESARIDEGVTVTGRSMGLVTSQGDVRGWMLPGPALAPLVGADRMAMSLLYLYEVRAGGRPRLVRVHAATAGLPVHFEGASLYWLGTGDDASSLREAKTLFANARGDMHEDLVGMIGIHASSAEVVPELGRILTSDEPADVRSEAAEWLSHHDTGAALSLLARAARDDVAKQVRLEAAESVGEMRLPAAFDTLLALSREHREVDVRREAVEAFGSRRDPGVVDALVRIANEDPDQSVQSEAVETLGDLPGGRGADAVIRLARSHRDPDVRREAVETMAEAMPADRAITELRRLIREESNADVQREAVETLGDLQDARVVGILTDLIDQPGHPDVQREAVETLGEVTSDASVVTVLDRIARNHPSMDVRREAVETLGERHRVEPRALDALLSILRAGQPRDIEREILETLADMDDPRARAAIRSIGRN